MQEALVSDQRLAQAKKVLFIAHLAIGDYQYLQTFFRAFARKWPHLTIDIWVDEVRRTRCFWKWKNLKKYSLYDWLKAGGLFRKVYDSTYSPAAYKASRKQARCEQYDIVISLATLRAHKYARLARFIAPQGYVVGIEKTTTMLQQYKKYCYRSCLNASFNPAAVVLPQGSHITAHYALWFERLVGVQVPLVERAPFINIPKEWVVGGSLRLLKWGIRRRQQVMPIIFINAFAKDKKRCWDFNKAFDLAVALQKTERFEHAAFIINTVPEHYAYCQRVYNDRSIKNTYLFAAHDNFFQLPAMLSFCDVIISVETSVMHIGAALAKPVVALMRKKNPEWAPWGDKLNSIITTVNRADWVDNISVTMVCRTLDALDVPHVQQLYKESVHERF